METKRTPEEIKAKIEELAADADNFTTDNYGSECADNGFFETYHSPTSTESTLLRFAEWLYNEPISN